MKSFGQGGGGGEERTSRLTTVKLGATVMSHPGVVAVTVAKTCSVEARFGSDIGTEARHLAKAETASHPCTAVVCWRAHSAADNPSAVAHETAAEMAATQKKLRIILLKPGCLIEGIFFKIYREL
jgi:hypothetical protein